MSVTFDLDMWLWPYVKLKKAYVIRCRFLYCTLVPGMMSASVIVYEIWQLVHFCDFWNSPVTFIVCQGHFHFIHQMDVMLSCSTKYDVCMFNRIWDTDKCLEIFSMTSQWRHYRFKFYEIFTKNLPSTYLGNISNFILIGHKSAEIQSREVNRWLCCVFL